MKLYITYISPYARLARILVLEKAMSERVDIVEAKTRAERLHFAVLYRARCAAAVTVS